MSTVPITSDVIHAESTPFDHVQDTSLRVCLTSRDARRKTVVVVQNKQRRAT